MNNRELVVKGIGKAVAAPDLIVITMNIEVTEPNYEKTMRRGSEVIDTLRAAIVSAGHDGGYFHQQITNLAMRWFAKQLNLCR